MREQWPFFRTRIDMLEMVLAKADADIARSYDERLVEPELLPLGAHLRDLLSQACSVVLGLTGQSQLLAHSPATLEFIRLRNTYLDPLHLLQAELLARSRQQDVAQGSPVEQALLVSVAGLPPVCAIPAKVRLRTETARPAFPGVVRRGANRSTRRQFVARLRRSPPLRR